MIGILRREILDRLLIVNEHHLRRVLAEYLLHYNTFRPHRTLARCHRLKPTPGHRRSTSQSTRSATSRSSAVSRTSIRSRLTSVRYCEKWQVTAKFVFSSPTGLTQRPSNDFYYPTGGSCNQGDTTVVQLEQRIHLLTFGKGWGEPSTCTGDGGIGWNTSANSETSTTSDDSGEVGGADNDPKLVQVSSGLWGPHKCVAASAPSPNGTTSTLSFACSHGDDPNCTDNIGIPASTTGCSAPRTNCFVGAYPNGWETLHADYWQTWNEAKNAPDSQTGNSDVSSDAGTFGDIVEDCVQGTGTANCSPTFITNTSPPQVYGSPSNP